MLSGEPSISDGLHHRCKALAFDTFDEPLASLADSLGEGASADQGHIALELHRVVSLGPQTQRIGLGSNSLNELATCFGRVFLDLCSVHGNPL